MSLGPFVRLPHLPFIVSPSSPHCSISQLPPVALFIVVLFGLVVALALSHCFAVVPIPTLQAVARSGGSGSWGGGCVGRGHGLEAAALL